MNGPNYVALKVFKGDFFMKLDENASNIKESAARFFGLSARFLFDFVKK